MAVLHASDPAGPRPLFGDNLSRALVEDVAARGWAFAPGALEPALVEALLAEARALEAEGALEEGRVGRGGQLARDRRVRRAAIRWLDGATPAQARFLEGCEALRLEVNRALFAGLFEFEAHFAVYPEGGFYARHLDAFAAPARAAGPEAGLGAKARRSRVLSLVAYLNPDWAAGDGGELALWETAPAGADGRPDLAALDAVPPAGLFPPEGGGLALMLSERIPHEVRPARRARYAIAGWFRVNASAAGLADPMR